MMESLESSPAEEDFVSHGSSASLSCQDENNADDLAFPAKKLQELLSELDTLKKEQESFRNDQEQWNSFLKEKESAQAEVQELRTLLVKHDGEYQEKLEKLKNDYEARLSKILKERDSMVVKYAHSEKEVIVAQNQRDAAEKKMKDLAKEKDGLLEKTKQLNIEKSKVCHMLEAKSNEYFASQREIDRMKEEINSREIKLRWAQSKLKSETENHQETQTKYEKCIQQIKQLKEEVEEWKRNLTELKSKENDGRAQNEAQVLEEKARWIVEKQNLEEQTTTYKNGLKEFEAMKIMHTQLVEENAGLLAKLQTMQKERSEFEQNIGHLKEQVSQQRQTLIQVQTKLAEMDGVQSQLERERERLSKNQEEFDSIRQNNIEMEEEMRRCQAKEVELLGFTQKLTETNVQLQSTLTSVSEKVQALEGERSSLCKKLEETEHKMKSLQLELQDERETRSSEASAWGRTVSEKSRLCEDLQTQVRELQNELASVRRKHIANVKELTRELKVTKKRLDLVESTSTAASVGNSNDITSLGSRTSSNTSINTAGIDQPTPEHSPSPTHTHVTFSPEWERTALLEKMIRIQRDNAKKSEKIDFLEEHVQDLTAEIKKKNKIIQFYLAREDSGSLTSDASDKYKAELAKHGGVMSSMYNIKTLDDGLSLELCLEINQKLQGVLEDTLLKNMTLKENLSTLGAEVARITQQYQALLHSK